MPYFDHAATSPFDQRLTALTIKGLEQPRNPSSVHRHGQRARAVLERARTKAASLLGVEADQVVFTSGASEANNLAIRGLASRSVRHRLPFGIAYSDLEHACVRETALHLERSGDAVLERLPVDSVGRAALTGPLAATSRILCLMAVQNETGVVQDLAGARDLARASNALWLCDATQAIGALDLRQYVVGWDLLSCSSHKLGGPPGVGLLAGPGLVQLDAVLTGGPQEGERRAGTQPVAFIEAFVQALTFAVEEREQRRRHLMELQDAFLARLAALGVAPERNGDPSITLPGFMNLGFAPMDGADLVIGLDAAGCSVSSGSACATGVMEPSAALRAMFPEDEARVRRAIRITLGPENTLAEVQQLAEVIAGLLKSQPRNAP